MLTLDLTNAPRWVELIPGLRVQLRPLTTALMVSARADPAIEALPDAATQEELALAMAKAMSFKPSRVSTKSRSSQALFCSLAVTPF